MPDFNNSGRYEYYSRLYEQTTRRITTDAENWRSFLTTAARLYKYSFPDQIQKEKHK